jgi:hypothetical protein
MVNRDFACEMTEALSAVRKRKEREPRVCFQGPLSTVPPFFSLQQPYSLLLPIKKIDITPKDNILQANKMPLESTEPFR